MHKIVGRCAAGKRNCVRGPVLRWSPLATDIAPACGHILDVGAAIVSRYRGAVLRHPKGAPPGCGPQGRQGRGDRLQIAAHAWWPGHPRPGRDDALSTARFPSSTGTEAEVHIAGSDTAREFHDEPAGGASKTTSVGPVAPCATGRP